MEVRYCRIIIIWTQKHLATALISEKPLRFPTFGHRSPQGRKGNWRILIEADCCTMKYKPPPSVTNVLLLPQSAASEGKYMWSFGIMG
jgi:hypothetical protein